MCYSSRMADFSELLALLREPGDDGVPETIYDDLSSSYNLAVEGGATRVAETESALAEANAEIARLKALNFDLLMAANADSGDEETTDKNDNPTESIVDPIAALFN